MAPHREDWHLQHEGAWLCLLLLALTVTCDAAAWGEEVEDEAKRRPSCPSCGMPTALAPEAEWQIMAELAKQQILSKLHLKERPNITHPVPRLAVANALRRLHPGRGQLQGLLGTPHWDAEEQSYEMISFAESDWSNSTNARLSFQFTRNTEHSVHILRAHLWVFFKSHRTGPANLTARLYLTRPGQAERSLVGERHLEVAWSGWHTFPLTPALQGFFDQQDKGLRLELQCDGCRDSTATFNTSDAHQPFLVAQATVRDTEHRVAKRSLKCDTNSKLCCRKDYYVDFKDIGWNNWIIKPEGYQINYCMGLCPMHIAGTPGMAASFHTTVLNLIKANNIKTSTSSCCVPTKHRPLSMLYYDKNHNIVKTDIPDMIVEACGCS